MSSVNHPRRQFAKFSRATPVPISDIGLKTDIHELGLSENGDRLYQFKYANDLEKVDYVGVMAQAILEKQPKAAITRSDGFFAMHYDQLDLKMTTLEQWQKQGIKAVNKH